MALKISKMNNVILERHSRGGEHKVEVPHLR